MERTRLEGEVPATEVPEKPVRRRFSAEYKLRILAEADGCTEQGQIGELLRREGLYSSLLSTWRRQRDEGVLASTREQKEKAGRVLTSKVVLAREGNVMGGHVPYGMDIVCFDDQGKEQWRCVYNGHQKRVKVYPDGRWGLRAPHGCNHFRVTHEVIEVLLDGFVGLSPKLKERANRRGKAIQREIERLQRDLLDLRVPWQMLKDDLTARQESLARAHTALNQEGHFRQKAEALKTVVDRIVCHFSQSGRRCTLKSIDIYAAEDGAIRPFSFPGVGSLQTDRRLRGKKNNHREEDPAEPRE